MEMWNSIDNLKSLSHGLMWATAILAILAAVVTGVRYYVDSRVNVLSSLAQKVETEIKEKSQSEREASLKLQVEAEAAKARERAAVLERGNIDLQSNLEKERSARLKLEAHIAPRRISIEHREAIIAAIKPFAGQKCRIGSILGDAEGKIYAEDFAKVLEAAGWDHHGDSGIGYHVWVPDPIGVELSVHQVNPRQGEVNPAMGALIKILKDLRLIGDPGVKMNAETPAGEIEIRIGSKPPIVKL